MATFEAEVVYVIDHINIAGNKIYESVTQVAEENFKYQYIRVESSTGKRISQFSCEFESQDAAIAHCIPNS